MLNCCIQYSMTVHNKEKIMSYKKTINCVDKWNNGVILVIEQIKQGTIKNNKKYDNQYNTIVTMIFLEK